MRDANAVLRRCERAIERMTEWVCEKDAAGHYIFQYMKFAARHITHYTFRAPEQNSRIINFNNMFRFFAQCKRHATTIRTRCVRWQPHMLCISLDSRIATISLMIFSTSPSSCVCISKELRCTNMPSLLTCVGNCLWPSRPNARNGKIRIEWRVSVERVQWIK